MMKPPDTDAFAKARRYGSAQGIPRLMIEPREKPGLEADSPSMSIAECSISSGEFLGILGMVEACRLLLYTNIIQILYISKSFNCVLPPVSFNFPECFLHGATLITEMRRNDFDTSIPHQGAFSIHAAPNTL